MTFCSLNTQSCKRRQFLKKGISAVKSFYVIDIDADKYKLYDLRMNG